MTVPANTPVVVVAKLTVKPESIDAVREICTRTVEQVHDEPGCQLYSLHESDGGVFVFIEQWADAAALKTHAAAPAATAMFDAVGEHLAAAPDIQMLGPIPAGDPAKGQLRQ